MSRESALTPVRVPDLVRGTDLRELPRCMPVTDLRPATRFNGEPATRRGVYVGNNTVKADEGLVVWTHYAHVRDEWPTYIGHLAIDLSDRAAIYLCLAWLADRGHPACLWMLPTTHGGRVEAWDGLSAWDVSAIVVARSVGRVARGLGAVTALAGVWRHDPNPGDAYESWGWTAWMRTRVDGRGAVRVYAPTRARPLAWGLAGWYYYRAGYGYQSPTSSGRLTSDAGKLAADRAALSDGCALLSPGGICLPDLGADK